MHFCGNNTSKRRVLSPIRQIISFFQLLFNAVDWKQVGETSVSSSLHSKLRHSIGQHWEITMSWNLASADVHFLQPVLGATGQKNENLLLSQELVPTLLPPLDFSPGPVPELQREYLFVVKASYFICSPKHEFYFTSS